MSKRAPYSFQEVSSDQPLYWRSLDEKARLHDPAFYEERQVEFTPEQLARPDAVTRRGFMSVLGAGMALAGAVGCRRPVEKIVPYAKMPEEVVPGVPSSYATVYVRRGDAIGLLIESHEGRPTKVEGNPDHPASLGAVDLITQATVLDLYDPDRSESPRKAGAPIGWKAATDEIDALLKPFEADGGAGLRVLSEPTLSPTFIRLRGAVAKRFPNAKFHTYAAVSDGNATEGARIATGTPFHTLPSYDKAKVILSLDSDFLQTESGSVRATKQFAAGRRLRSTKDGMSRLYVVEPGFSTTGASADHRYRLAASQVEAFTVALAAELSSKYGVDFGKLAEGLKSKAIDSGLDAAWVSTVAKDLAAAKGHSLVVVGARQPAIVHALALAINAGLNNLGTTVRLTGPVDGDVATLGDLKSLVDDAKAKKVKALFVFGGNPVYDAPADLGFGEVFASIPTTIHLSSHVDETSSKATLHLNRTHEFEAWGDQRGIDGTLSIQQPLIAPLKDRRSDIELLSVIAGHSVRTGHALVKETLASLAPSSVSTERAFGRVLRDGYVALGSSPAPAVTLDADAIASAITKSPKVGTPSADALEVTFGPCPKLFDGRHANNPWLLELPDPMTKVVWDNVALLSPKTAKDLGLKGGDLVTIERNGRSVKVAVWALPGVADNVVTLTLGWGRTAAGRVGNAKGFDVNPLRTSDALGFGTEAKLTKTGERYTVTQTQEHDSMEGRPIAREATLATYKKSPQFAEIQAPPPKPGLPLWHKADYSKGHRWGMTIDLNACTGCSACVVACQAENNIFNVGKEQVSKGREMHWLRVDRYFVGDEANPKVAHQPLACVQCEEAPCENVCPVNATAHSPEGLNDMAYNRCIGTRYCANNCPYKVRRFNYLDWKSEFWNPHDLVGAPVDPPATVQMQYNPDVTVRMRGVMEKCTYCVQRIQRVKIDTKRAGRDIRDGEITPACAQTCPADAIVFGDLNDKSSRVAKLTELDRRYRLLADIGTAPRTTYLGKVRNPNGELADGATTEKHG